MIRKLMCWLGWHEWIFVCLECQKIKCKDCFFSKKEKSRLYCKHCGALKHKNDTQNNLRITDE